MIAVVFGISQILAQSLPKVTNIQYWIDDNHTAPIVSTQMEFDIDCKSMSPGLHFMNYRVADDNGSYSGLYQHAFLKLQALNHAVSIDSLQYWWDNMTANATVCPYSGEQFSLSTDALPYGLHSFNYRVMDNAGRWSQSRSHYFYRGEALDSARIVSYSYWWNDLTSDIVTREFEQPVSTVIINETLNVPEKARTDFAGHYTAIFSFYLTDNLGRSTFMSTNVTYPDNDAPVTDIDADNYVASSTVKITWNEKTNDLMGDYNVYFSKDGGPFVLWLPDTKSTSATFKGERGSRYVFTVTGRDALGNRETYDETKCVSVIFE